MRTFRLLVFPLLAAMLLAMPSVGWCQYPAFTLARLGTAPSVSIVRSYTATQAVAYYSQGEHGYLALVDVSGTVKQTRLDALFEVRDMRIVGDELYFCGQYRGYGFLGYINLTGFNAGIPQVKYYYENISRNLTPLNKMVAYKDAGMVKVVAVGTRYYMSSGLPCYCSNALPPYDCADHQVVEVDFAGGSVVNVVYAQIANLNGVEESLGVVATDNYVAVLTKVGAVDLAIHRCDKHDVLGSFGQYVTYPIAALYDQSEYVCCHTHGDGIAVVTLAVTPGSPNTYSTQIRTFDLLGEVMTTAQTYSLIQKAQPWEMVYSQSRQTLVLLEDQELAAHGWGSTFVHVKPFASAPYSAACHLETASRLPYQSLDKVGDDYYLSTGGDYWLLKDMGSSPSTSTCFKECDIPVVEIPTDLGVHNGRGITVVAPTLVNMITNDYSTNSYSILFQ